MSIQKIRFIALTISVLFFISFVITGYAIYSYIGSTIMLSLLLLGNISENFIVMVSGIICAPLVNAFGVNVFFIFSLLASLKIIVRNGKKKIKLDYVFFGLLLLFIEIIGDFGKIQIGRFLYVFSMLVYFVVFISLSDFRTLDSNQVIDSIIVTLSCAIFGTIIASGGDINSYILSTDNLTRLGNEAISLGGAMEIPIYCLIIISIVISLELMGKIRNRFPYYIIAILVFFIGFLSISRVYILGLLVLAVWVLLSVIKKPNRKSLLLILVVSFFGLSYIYQNFNQVQLIIARYSKRTSLSDVSSSRFLIFTDIFRYLNRNISSIFIGNGVKNYVQVGFKNGYLFSYMAHNLYLDLLMSWGIIGYISIVTLVGEFASKLRKFYSTKVTMISLLPSVVLGSCYMTGGSFAYFSVYMYIIILTIFAFSFGKKEIRN